MSDTPTVSRYLSAIASPFWQQVYKAELEYILGQLTDGERILSVGCGPAVIEAGLAGRGFAITLLDSSAEMMSGVPEGIPAVVGDAETMAFPDASFDVVLFVVSLQFIKDYRQAVDQAVRVLRPGGKLIVLLLNPQSAFFLEKRGDPDSVVSKIRHPDIQPITVFITRRFRVQTEYLLGISGDTLHETVNPEKAALFSVIGVKPEETDGIEP